MPPVGRPVIRLVILLGAVFFVALFGTVIPALVPEARIAAQVIFVPPLAAYAVLIRRAPIDMVDVAVALALIGFALTVLTSRDLQGSVETLGLAATYALLFRLMRDISGSNDLREVAALGACSAATVWIAVMAGVWVSEKIAWVQFGGGIPNLVESRQTLFWLSGNMIPFLALGAIGLLGWVSVGWRRLVLPALVVATAIALPLSGGRAGLVGFAAGGLVLAAMHWTVVSRYLLRRRRLIVASAAFVLAMLFGVILVFGERLLESSGLISRIPIWEQALAIFIDHPLTGSGPSTYAWLRLEYAPAPPRLHAPHAHSAVLQALAEGGIVLILSMVLVVTAVSAAIHRRWAMYRFRERLTLAAIAGFGVAAQLDEPARLPALAAIMVSLVAWLVGPTVRQESVPRLPVRALPLIRSVPLIALLVGVAAAVPIDLARLQATLARRDALQSDLGGAVAHARGAVSWYPHQGGYRLLLGQLEALSGDVAAAAREYEVATSLNPFDARGWAGRAAVAEDADDRLVWLTRAAMLGDQPQYAWRLAVELERRDQTAAAVSAYARAIAMESALIALLPDRATGVTREAVVAQLPDAMAELSGAVPIDPEAVEADIAFVEGRTRLPPPWAALAAARDGEWRAAHDFVRDVRDERPYDGATWRLVRRVAQLECDAAASLRALRLAQLTAEGFPDIPVDPVYRTQDVPYDEIALDAYQPEGLPFPPEARVWPGYLIRPTCGPTGE